MRFEGILVEIQDEISVESMGDGNGDEAKEGPGDAAAGDGDGSAWVEVFRADGGGDPSTLVAAVETELMDEWVMLELVEDDAVWLVRTSCCCLSNPRCTMRSHLRFNSRSSRS